MCPLCGRKATTREKKLWGSHSRLLRWETQAVSICTGFPLAQMFLISHVQIDSTCKTLLAVLLVDEAWWQKLWHFLILPRPCSSCVVSRCFGS